MKFASDLKGPSLKTKTKNTTAEFLLSLFNSANLWRDCKRKQMKDWIIKPWTHYSVNHSWWKKNKITKMSIMITIIITNRRTWKFSLQHTRTKILLDYMTLWSSQHEPLRGVQGQEVVTEAQDIGQLGTHIINPPPWTQQNSVLIKGTEREIIIASEQAWKTFFWLLGGKNTNNNLLKRVKI